MSDEPDSQTLERIAQARTLAGRPVTDRLVNARSFGALMAEHARTRPEAPFLLYLGDAGEERWLRYGDFHQRALALAAYLESRGLGPGDRVATVTSNHAETVVAYFAILYIGAVVVPFNVGEDDERLLFTVTNSKAKAVFVMGGLTDRVDALKPRLPGVLDWIEVEGSGTPGYVAMDAAVAAGAARAAAG
ncbi:MAG: acyl--CoA ligase, partial [Myxococcales bacterium]|nr:acyl--CoA ligase [Myxococcales bacterium]